MVVLCASAALGQNQTTGRIAGTVKDPNGALIAGAKVTVESKTTAAERIGTTDDQGNFTVSLLPPGLYHLKVAAVGFNSLNSDSVQVGITETTTINVQLTLAGADTITVNIAQLTQKDRSSAGPSTLPRSQSCRWQPATSRKSWRSHPARRYPFPTTPRLAATRRTCRSTARA